MFTTNTHDTNEVCKKKKILTEIICDMHFVLPCGNQANQNAMNKLVSFCACALLMNCQGGVQGPDLVSSEPAPGRVIEKIGTAAASDGDSSVPGLVLKIE